MPPDCTGYPRLTVKQRVLSSAVSRRIIVGHTFVCIRHPSPVRESYVTDLKLGRHIGPEPGVRLRLVRLGDHSRSAAICLINMHWSVHAVQFDVSGCNVFNTPASSTTSCWRYSVNLKEGKMIGFIDICEQNKPCRSTF